MHGFLLPEVAKQEMRERGSFTRKLATSLALTQSNTFINVVAVAQKQRKHLLAAHREIHGTGSGIVDKGNGSPPPSPPEYTEKYATQSSEEQLDSDQLPEAADYTEKYPKGLTTILFRIKMHNTLYMYRNVYSFFTGVVYNSFLFSHRERPGGGGLRSGFGRSRITSCSHQDPSGVQRSSGATRNDPRACRR